MNTTKQVSCEEQLGTKGSDSTKELIEDAKAAGFVFSGDALYCNGRLETKLAKFAELQRQRERQAVPSGINFGAIVDALEAISNDIRPEVEHLAKLIYAYADQITAAPPADTVKQDDYEAMKRDAERYRWLRDRLAIEDIEKLQDEFWGVPQEEESLKTDNAIDAAMLISPQPIVEAHFHSVPNAEETK